MSPDRSPLDVADPANGSAIQAALNAVDSVGPEHETLLQRVLDESADPLLRGQAEVLMAAFEQARGRTAEATALYRAGLPKVWGSGTRAEANGLMNYAAVCVSQRRAFEGLALLRRACEYAEARENAAALALARTYLARTLVELEDWERLGPLLDEIERLLVHLDDGPREYVEMVAVTTAVEAAFRRGDASAASALKDRLETVTPSMEPGARHYHRALVLATEGRHQDALEQVAVLRALDLDGALPVAPLLDVELHCYSSDTTAAQWRETAERLLDELAGSPHDLRSAGDRLVMAGRLARRLSADGGPHDLVQRAVKVAAGGALERIAELERFLRALPQLCFAGPDDQEILDDYRARFLARHETLLDVLRRIFDGSPESLPGFEAVTDDKTLWLCVCAWCRLLRGPDGLWLPVERIVVPTGPLRVTHGICRRCRDRELARVPPRT